MIFLADLCTHRRGEENDQKSDERVLEISKEVRERLKWLSKNVHYPLLTLLLLYF